MGYIVYKARVMQLYKYFWALFMVLTIFLLGGCGSSTPVQKSNPKGIEIQNFTFAGDNDKVTFKKIPERVIVCGNSGADTLIDLGVGNKIVALSLTEHITDGYYKGKLPNAMIVNGTISKEQVISLQPDFILGWRRFFGEKALGDTTEWKQKGIPAYIQDASGPIPGLEKFPPCTVESEKQFIRNMGLVFHKEQRANEIIATIDQALNYEKNKDKKIKVLVVEFNGRLIEVFGKNLLSGDIVTKLGGDVVDYGNPFVSKEDIISCDADMIFVVYHGDENAENQALDMMRSSIYSNIPAVKNNRLVPLPYKMIVATGSDTSKTILYMRKAMYPND